MRKHALAVVINSGSTEHKQRIGWVKAKSAYLS